MGETFRLGMKFTWVLVTGCLFLCTEGTTLREKRSTNCPTVFAQCAKSAKDAYDSEVQKGDDEWMDWRERKTCNYIEEAVKKCGDKLVEQKCANAVVMNLKDAEMAKILKTVEGDDDWDDSLCDPVKEYRTRHPAPKADNSSGSRITASVVALVLGYLMF